MSPAMTKLWVPVVVPPGAALRTIEVIWPEELRVTVETVVLAARVAVSPLAIVTPTVGLMPSKSPTVVGVIVEPLIVPVTVNPAAVSLRHHRQKVSVFHLR